MQITSREAAGSASLNEYASRVAGIWGSKDESRSLHDIWLHVIRHASGIAEEVRRDRPVAILEQLSRFVLWVLTFVGRADAPIGCPSQGERAPEESLFRVRFRLSDIVWNKYPWCCPVCFPLVQLEYARLKCTCISTPQESIEERYQADTTTGLLAKKEEKRERISRLRQYARKHVRRRPKTIDAFQRMFQDVYRANVEQATLPSIAFHLLEEVGEVGDALLNLYTFHKMKVSEISTEELGWRMTELEDEIADVFSWVFALVIKLDGDRVNVRSFLTKFRPLPKLELLERPIHLSEIIWWTYGSPEHEKLWCKHCRETGGDPCKCPITFLTKPEDIATIAALP